MTTPNKHIPYVPEGTLDPAAGTNDALNFIDALLQTAVISMDLTAPPGSPANGDLYIVAGAGGTATGAWATHELDLARYVTEGAYWQFFEAGTEVSYVLNRDDGQIYKHVDGSPDGWVLAAGLSDAPSDGFSYVRKDGAWVRIPLVDDIAFSATPTVDWSTCDIARLTLTGNVSALSMTGAVDGQKCILELKQDGTGGRTFAFAASTVRFGTTITSYTITSTANLSDKIGFIYNASASRYDVVAVAKGF